MIYVWNVGNIFKIIWVFAVVERNFLAVRPNSDRCAGSIAIGCEAKFLAANGTFYEGRKFPLVQPLISGDFDGLNLRGRLLIRVRT